MPKEVGSKKAVPMFSATSAKEIESILVIFGCFLGGGGAVIFGRIWILATVLIATPTVTTYMTYSINFAWWSEAVITTLKVILLFSIGEPEGVFELIEIK